MECKECKHCDPYGNCGMFKKGIKVDGCTKDGICMAEDGEDSCKNFVDIDDED